MIHHDLPIPPIGLPSYCMTPPPWTGEMPPGWVGDSWTQSGLHATDSLWHSAGLQPPGQGLNQDTDCSQNRPAKARSLIAGGKPWGVASMLLSYVWVCVCSRA